MGLRDWLSRARREFTAGRLERIREQAVTALLEGRLQEAADSVTRARLLSRQELEKDDVEALDRMHNIALHAWTTGEKELAIEVSQRWFAVVMNQLDLALPYPECLDHLEEILIVCNNDPEIARRLAETADRLRAAEQEGALFWTLRGLGRVLQRSGRMADAEPPFREAADLGERVFGSASRELAAVLDELSGVLFTNGEDREAIAIGQRGMEILQSDPTAPSEPAQEALAKVGLALVHLMRLGEPDKAETFLEEAERLIEKAAEKEFLPWSPEARKQRLLRLAEPLMAPFTLGMSLIKNLKERGGGWDPFAAMPLYDKHMFDISDLELAELQLLVARMLLQATLGQEPNLDLFVPFGESFIPSLLSAVDAEEDGFDYSEQLLELEGHMDPVQPIYDRHLNDMAAHPEYLPPGATERLMREAVAKRALALGEGHTGTAYARFKLAQLLDKTGGDGAEIESLLQGAVEAWRNTLEEGHLQIIDGIRALAGLYASTGREKEAWPLLLEAAAGEDRQIANVFSFTSEEQRTSFLERIEETYERSLVLAAKLGPGSAEVAREAFGLVLRRKTLVGRAQRSQWESLLSQNLPELEARIGDLGRVRQEITDRLLGGAVSGEDEDPELAALRERQRQLEADLAREAAGSALVREVSPTDLEALCRALPEGSVLVEVVLAETAVRGVFEYQRGYQSHYLAFALPAGNLQDLRMLDLGGAFEISDHVRWLREAVLRRNISREIEQPADEDPVLVETAGTWLYQAIMEPILALAGERERFLISPDGELSLLPFEILPDGEGGHLIDRYSFSYLASGREVLRFGAELSGEPAEAVVIADPDYDLRSEDDTSAAGGSFFQPLEHAPAEGRHVAELLGVEPWTGAQAVESRLRELRSPRILHLATHGFLFEAPDGFGSRPELPGRLQDRELHDPLLLSGLALSGANTWLSGGRPPEDAGDGLLTAAEVATLHLVDTELVVLSACKTAVGTVRAGEGVMGLRRSFALAGARTLVMSLWEVPDLETRELMESFYRYLLVEGKGRAEALRQAQLDLKASRNSAPFAWGAFICQGDPGPLRRPAKGPVSPQGSP